MKLIKTGHEEQLSGTSFYVRVLKVRDTLRDAAKEKFMIAQNSLQNVYGRKKIGKGKSLDDLVMNKGRKMKS